MPARYEPETEARGVRPCPQRRSLALANRPGQPIDRLGDGHADASDVAPHRPRRATPRGAGRRHEHDRLALACVLGGGEQPSRRGWFPHVKPPGPRRVGRNEGPVRCGRRLRRHASEHSRTANRRSWPGWSIRGARRAARLPISGPTRTSQDAGHRRARPHTLVVEPATRVSSVKQRRESVGHRDREVLQQREGLRLHLA